jgi:hypothetical protein
MDSAGGGNPRLGKILGAAKAELLPNPSVAH